jgi:hypothetical protein
MNDSINAAFISILTERINQDGKCDDAEVCKDIAAYLNMLPFTVHYSDTLYEFIAEYGEDVDDTYVGRDEEGEKRFITHNPDTNWHERIRRELARIGYFKRHQEWWAANRAA